MKALITLLVSLSMLPLAHAEGTARKIDTAAGERLGVVSFAVSCAESVAYLQSGQDARAKEILEDAAAATNRLETTHDMGEHYMTGMFPYYRTKLPVFFDLEMRDWKSAAALEPVAGANPETRTTTYWARTVAAGHLHQPKQAQADLADYDALMDQAKKGKNAYFVDSTGTRIERGEMLAWTALSPNRFNGLLNAGLAAEAAGNGAEAARYFAALLKSTDGGARSSRPELDHVKNFMASAKLAVQ